MAALDDFTPLIGGIPIMVDDQIIGGVGVSGASSAQQDEELAIAGAAAAKDSGKTAVASATITYFDTDQVKAAFAKGTILLDGSDNRNYMIHASRRDTPGMAEIHTKDSDIIYVLGGIRSLGGWQAAADSGTAWRSGDQRLQCTEPRDYCSRRETRPAHSVGNFWR